MDIDFLAIDFETACAHLNSACSVGIVAVKDLCIVDSVYSILKPPNLYFDDRNVRVHGITPDMAEGAPTLDELWTEIKWMFSEHIPVVAHNAHFDMSALRLSTCAEIPDFPYIDSMQIAAPLVSGSRSLAHCADELHIKLDDHHNALADAKCSAEIAILGIKSAGCCSMWEYLSYSPHVTIHKFRDLVPQQIMSHKSAKSKFAHAVSPSDIFVSTSIEFDTAHPFYGKNIVFTGELSIDRREAMQMVADVGGILKSGVSCKTDYLVVGRQDISIVGDDGLSSKQERALEINQSGKGSIISLTEDEFLALLHSREGVLSHG